MADTLVIETPVATVLEVSGLQGPQGPQGASQADVLTAQGDLLYRGASEAARLPIGTSGQVLKVSGGVPAWANESGGVPTSRTISAGTGLTGGGDLSANRTLAVSYGTTAGTACEGNDARLSDARTPSSTLAHAASHGPAGSDPVFDQNLNTDSSVVFEQLAIGALGTVDFSAAQNMQLAPVSTKLDIKDTASEFVGALRAQNDSLSANRNYDLPDRSGELMLVGDAPASHSHGNITNGGLVGTTANLPLKTGTGGIVEAGSFGTASGTFAAGDDSRITGAAQKSANLSDLASASTARTNLGLGTAATAATGDFAAASHTHTASAISDSTTAGRALLTAADAAAQRTSLGLATIATSGSASDLGSGTVPIARIPTGTTSTTVALGNHSHELTALAATGATNGHVLTANGSGGVTFAAASGGVGGSTGSVSTAALRASGTGGSTVATSDINIEDATTSTANNVTLSNQHSGQTNSSLVLQPKGTGAFVLGPKPDGTTTGGNARGARAVDLQWEPRFAATMVASGQASAILNGLNNTASGTYAVAWGQGCTASGIRSTAGGFNTTASGAYSGFAIGWNLTASGSYGATAIGAGSVADRQGMLAFASGRPWSNNAGVAQNIVHVLHGKTTTNAAVELLAGDWNEGTTRLTVPSGRVMTGLLTIVGTKSDGATVASYMRQVTIKNVGGTTSLVGTVNTVGTDEAGGTSISITANDTNDALKVEATGVASQTFRWVCTANMTEMTYGT